MTDVALLVVACSFLVYFFVILGPFPGVSVLRLLGRYRRTSLLGGCILPCAPTSRCLSDVQRRCEVGDTITRLDAAGMTFAYHLPFAFEVDGHGISCWILREQHVAAQISDAHSIPQIGRRIEEARF